MMTMPASRAIFRMPESVSRLAVQPVGFDGVLTKRTRVLSVIAAFSLSRSRLQRPASKSSETSRGVAPISPAAAAKFGQVGPMNTTSSPVPASAISAIWIACMPEPVTKKRFGSRFWS